MYYSDLSSTSLVDAIKKLISKAKIFYIVSPFITKEAFSVFKNELKEFTEKGGKIKVITSTFTESGESFNYDDLSYIYETYKEAIEIKVQVVQKTEQPIHKKIYGFMYENDFDIILGSANFTYRGLYGKEVSTLQAIDTKINLKKEIDFMWNENGDYKLINFNSMSRKDWINLEHNHYKIMNFDENTNTNIKLHNYQLEIIERYKLDMFEETNHSVILPTGTGKTIVAAHMFLEFTNKVRNAKMLFTTHRVEIINNAYKRYKQVNNDLDAIIVNTENQKALILTILKISQYLLQINY